MTDDHMFWEARRTSAAPLQRLDSVLVLEFEPVDPLQASSVLAACVAADAIGYVTLRGRLNVWIRAEAVVAMLRGLGSGMQPARISAAPTTNLRQDEIDLIRQEADAGTHIAIEAARIGTASQAKSLWDGVYVTPADPSDGQNRGDVGPESANRDHAQRRRGRSGLRRARRARLDH